MFPGRRSAIQRSIASKGVTMSQSYLVPIVQQTINGQLVSVPKYFSTDLAGLNISNIAYGLEPLGLVTLARANSALQAEPDVYTFNSDLTVPMSDEDAATLSAFLETNNVPSDGIISGLPFVTTLVYILQIHLLAQYIAGQTGQAIFAGTNLTLGSPISNSVSVSAAVSAAQSAQSAQASQGVGNVGVGVGGGAGIGGSGGSSGGSDGSSSGPFDFAMVSNFTPIGEFLDSASQTWAGGPISLGGF
jgi:hypothetical protein